jgi:hypothetical protein
VTLIRTVGKKMVNITTEKKEKIYCGDLNDKIDGLKFISQVRRSEFNERRVYELKIVFTSLTFYVLCVAAKYNGGVKLPNDYLFKFVVLALFLLLARIISAFLCDIHIANYKNKTFAQYAENDINKMLNLNIFERGNRDPECTANNQNKTFAQKAIDILTLLLLYPFNPDPRCLN